MCGIVGAIGEIDPEMSERVDRMLAAQVHRGPDDSGKFITDSSPGVILGFRRLAIMDLTLDGHQPMIDDRQGNAIVFNGEIYNFAEIRQALEADGVHFKSRCDTEVLLRAYAKYGADVVNRLRGMFAFAIYDAANQRVFLARDRLGIKPLYLAELERFGRKVTLFSSELRGILASGLVAPKLNPEALDSYLWNGFVVGPTTMIRGVSLLPAGTCVTIDLRRGQSYEERYWSLGPRATLSEGRAKQELENELLIAAKQHLVSDVPLGIFLSGGVDSSAVAALAMRSATSKVKTFHIGFEEKGFDESTYARRVANELGTEHAEFRLTQSVFVEQLDDAIGSLDQPTFDAINTYFVSRVVREAGFTVALAGTGGDELFGGYQSFQTLPKALSVTRALARLPVSSLSRKISHAIHLGFRRNGFVAPQTRWGKSADLLSSHGNFVSLYQVLYALYTREFVGELNSAQDNSRVSFGLTPERRSDLEVATFGLSPLAATSVTELGMFIGERLLRDSDAASMAVSLELRVPFLDHRVVEAAQRVPENARFAPIGKKMLLRNLAMPDLDPTIFDRPKSGFVLPISVWAKDRLASDIENTFSDHRLVKSVGLRPEALACLWHSFREGAKGMYWSRVWSPYVFLRWCRTHGVAL
jgi:asparagine synthase (glutamine-hydrolysing)